MGKKLSMLFCALLACALVVCLARPLGVEAASKAKLNATKKTLYLGEKFQLELEGAKGTVKWSTSKKKVATVADGTVTTVKTGKATIKAKDTGSGKTYKCKITVKKNSLSDKKLSLKAGESIGLTLKGNTPAEWISSDDSVAIVNNGTVTALKKGKATITAKVGSKKYTCKVTVTENKEANDEPVELVLWCLGGDDGQPSHSYVQAIEDLKISHPNVTVKIETFQTEDYKIKIRTAMENDELPDIFFTWSCSFLGNFVNAGKVYCLDDILSKYVKSGDVTKAMLENTTYDKKRYGIPLTMNVVVLYANMDLLKQAGYSEVPKTINELMACCDKLLEKGITPFGCSEEAWCISEYLETIIEKNIGADALNDIFAGKASFNNEGIAESVEIFRNMIEKGYFGSSSFYMNKDEILNGFMNNEYAFYMNGSWNCGAFAFDPEFSKNIAIAELPVINSKNSQLGELIGGPSETLAVAASSKNADIAAEYAVALGKLISKYGYLEGAGLPSWKIGYDDSEVNELTRQVSKLCANAKAYVLFGDTVLSGEETDIYLEHLIKIAYGEIDGKTFIAALGKALR